nr:30S ribosome-binding factor RbfA [Bacilli bacterium]
MKLRTERLSLQMQKEISDILQTQLKDPRIGFVTVTGVEVTNDLSHAKVYISVLGDHEKRQESLLSLQRAKGFIRTEVGRRIRMRTSPELHFKLDESIDYSERIGHVLQEIAHNDKMTNDGVDEHE